MAGAEVGGDSGRSTGPDDTSLTSSPTDLAAVTQSVPFVTPRASEPAGGPVRTDGSESAVVRAVAKRAAAALPALGPAASRQGLPRPARTGRAAAGEPATTAGTEDQVSEQATPPGDFGDPTAVAPTGAEPATATAAEPEPWATVEPQATNEPFATVEPDSVPVEPEPLATVEPEPSVPVEPEPLATVEPEPSVPVEPEPLATVEPEPSVPVEPFATAEPLPTAPVEAELLTAVVVPDEPESTVVVAELIEPAGGVRLPRELAFAEAHTDEWLMPSDLAATQATTAVVSAELVPSAGGVRTAELVRPGPVALAADSWDADPADSEGLDDYHGRRRASTSATRIWVLVVLAIVAVTAAVVVPLLLRSSRPSPSSAPVLVPAETGEIVAPTTTDGVLGPAVSSGPAAPHTTARPGGVIRTAQATPTSPAAPTTTAAGFAPLTIPAEQVPGATYASWQKDDGPGCGYAPSVIRTGKWGWPYFKTGALTLSNITVATAGTYTMTVHYIVANDTSRNSVITVNGTTLPTQTFVNSEAAGTPDGCVDPKDVTITLHEGGGNTIAFANPSGKGPTVDYIVLSRA